MGGAQNNHMVTKNILAVQSESDTSCFVQVIECTILTNPDLSCLQYHNISYILRDVRDPLHGVGQPRYMCF